jgi:hypothetical protein
VTQVSASVVQVRLSPQLVSAAQLSPGPGGVAQAPQAFPGTIAQNALWHWPEYSQGEPSANEPLTC